MTVQVIKQIVVVFKSFISKINNINKKTLKYTNHKTVRYIKMEYTIIQLKLTIKHL